ncbi:MAG TPA: polysaccharide biosynthesis C-terminal domain-containing protein [Candidatus Acidoferrales bacterium]|nr:polysaccharide biosynthesis C-terminal domain-containing protein [Candidatus Acidoferrales bacterium]
MSLGARVGRAIFWGQAGRVGEAAVCFVFYLFLARALGPASYGLFALGTSLAGACVFLTLFGLGPETLGRFVPEIAADGRPNRVRRFLGVLLVIRGAAIFGVSALIFGLRGELAQRFHFPLLAESLALMLLVFAARSTLDLLTYFSAGMMELRRVAGAKLVASVAAPGLFLILWLRQARGVNAAWLAIAFGSLAGIIVLAAPHAFPVSAARAGVRESLPLRRILAFGLFAWATNFFLYILGDNMDVLLLGWLVPNRSAIGYYAVGAKIVFSLTGLLLGWVTLASVPSLTESWQRGGAGRLAAVVEGQWKLGVVCLIAPLFFLCRFAREIVAIFYSPAYAPSVPVIEILCVLLACGVVCGFSIQGGVLYVLDHERVACAAVGFAALFNLASEIVLVRRMGIAGAAWATGISFVIVAILCTVAGAFYIPFHFPGRFIGRVIAAAGIALAPTFWLHPGALPALAVSCALYGTLFLGSLAILKPLTGRDSAGLHRVNHWFGAWAERLFADVTPTVKEG